MLALYLSVLQTEEEKTEFEAIYDSYEQFVFAVAWKRLENSSLAEDCTQDTFLSIAQSFEAFQEVPEENRKAYLFRVADRCATKIRMTETKRKKERSLDDKKFPENSRATP